MSAAPDVNSVIDNLVGRTVPPAVNFGSLALIAVGVVSFAAGLFAMGDGGVVAWSAYLVGLVYTLSIAQGGVMFAVIQTGTWGRWGRPVKRIAESFGVFMPIGWVLLVVFLIFGLRLYPWHPYTIVAGGPVSLAPHFASVTPSKELWLSPLFFIARSALGIGFLVLLDLAYLRASFAPDLVMAANRLGAKAPRWWTNITGGNTNVEAALRSSLNLQSFLVPLLAVSYALLFSMLAFDLMMSLSPWWASNMFGAWTFVSAFWLSLAALGATAMIARDWLKIGAFVRPNVTHDLGKLMLAGCMFWAYTGFAQLLPIWYTDMPEETNFLLIRLFLPEWTWLAQAVGVLCFVTPFTMLLSRGVKKMRWPFVGICSVILVGVFLERTLLVLPSVYVGDPRNPLVIAVCVGTWLGFVGLLVQVVSRVLAAVPPVSITDPHLETHPWDVHVHATDAAHH